MDRIFGNGSISSRSEATWKPEPLERGTYSILSSCLVTLGLCVWTAIHLNVPEQNGRLAQILRKLGWMLLAFIAPELVAFTAWQQYTVAGDLTKRMEGYFPNGGVDEPGSRHLSRTGTKDKLKDKLRAIRPRRPTAMQGNEDAEPGENTSPQPAAEPDHHGRQHKWTIVHSYFAAMGGFVVRIKDKDYNYFPMKSLGGDDQMTHLTITSKGLPFLEEKIPGFTPDLSRSRIQDKSKGSMLAKSLVCIQATWFCIQCLSRVIQGLAISLLELNTFGHSICTLLIYWMWWDKPLDIEEPEEIVISHSDASYGLLAHMCLKSDPDQPKPLGLSNPEEPKKWERCWPMSCLNFLVGYDPKTKTCWLLNHLSDSSRARTYAFEKSWLGWKVGIAHYWLDLQVSPDPSYHSGPISRGRKRIPYGDPVEGIHLRTRYIDTSIATPTPSSSIDIRHSDIKRWKLALAYSGPPAPYNGLATRVRNLPRVQEITKKWSLYLGFSITGLIYGGLHCLAWNAPLTSQTERALWRLASTMKASTGILVLLPLSWRWKKPFWEDPASAVHTVESWWDAGRDWKSTRWLRRVVSQGAWKIAKFIVLSPLLMLILLKCVWDLFLVGLILIYALARVYLVVECFINLGHLPPLAYQLPEWSQYVPHIA